MKFKLLSILILGAISCSTAWAAGSATDAINPASAPAQAQTATQNKDGEVLGWLMVVDNNEIAAAKAAEGRKLNHSVEKYAAMLSKDHTKNLHETLKVSQKAGEAPVENDAAKALKQKGEQELTTLKGLDNQKFQGAFIDAMVNGHTEVLSVLDQSLPNVTNPEVKKHLEATRSTVMKHLEDAKKIQTKLQEK